MEVNKTFVVSCNNVSIQQKALCNIFRNFTGHVVTLDRNNSRVLVRVFLFYFFVLAFQQGKNLIISSVCLTHQFVLVAVSNVFFCNIVSRSLHNGLFNKVLNCFNIHFVFFCSTLFFNGFGDIKNLAFGKLITKRYFFICLRNSSNNFLYIKNYFNTVSLNDFHRSLSPT